MSPTPAMSAKVVERTLARFGRIDAVVNNAAIGPLGTVLDTDEAMFDRIMAVNLKGPYLMSRAVLPHMIRAGRRRRSSTSAPAPAGASRTWRSTAPARAASSALSAAMAYDFFHDRIRVNTVIPGGGGIVSGMSLGRVGGDASRLRQGRAGHGGGPGRRPATTSPMSSRSCCRRRRKPCPAR